jgi:DNA-directed RNA polymerase subunit omega
LNSDLTKQALAKIGNPNVLVNLVSKRVRQLTTPGSQNRPLIADIGHLGAGDIALTEIIEGKLGFNFLEAPEIQEAPVPASKKRKRAASGG